LLFVVFFYEQTTRYDVNDHKQQYVTLSTHTGGSKTVKLRLRSFQQ